MNYRLEEKEGFTLIGVKEFTTMKNGENFKNIPKMWKKLPEQILGQICAMSDVEPSGVLGVCADMYNDGFDYWIAAASSKPCPVELQQLEVPACTWAVFEVEGPIPEAIQDTFVRIFSEWLPASGYEHAAAPEIERYPSGDMSLPSYKSEVWIPVVKKQIV